MTLILGNCPSRDAERGKHKLTVDNHITYFDCRGRIIQEADGRQNPKIARIYYAVANCAHCLKPLVLFNGGFPTSVTWIRPWRELVDESELIEHHVIEEGMF